MAKKVTPKTTETKKKAPARKRAAATKSASLVASTALPEEQIRARAYEIYRAGRNPSNPDADWLQAEQELRAGSAS